MPEVLLPRLSDSMEEGTVQAWLVADGETVQRGQEIVEIETDKATLAYAADADGVLQIVAAEGDTLPVGAVIAHILPPGQDPAPASAKAPAAEPEPVAELAGGPEPAPRAPASEPAPVAAAGSAPVAERLLASPRARRRAAETGVELGALSGRGPGGRIVEADVLAAAEQPAAVSAAVATDAGVRGTVRRVELSRPQQLVARRMLQAKQEQPEFSLQMQVDVSEALALREQLRALDPDQAPPSLNDWLVRACARALREQPHVNSSYVDGAREEYSEVNVALAVATEDGMLHVPVIHGADRLALGEVARRSRELARRARAGQLHPAEMDGATFTVSNLGMLGVDVFQAVLSYPQAAILAAGAACQQPVVVEGGVVIRSLMTLTLTCDHRVLYGAEGARFLGRVRELLQQPLLLAL